MITLEKIERAMIITNTIGFVKFHEIPKQDKESVLQFLKVVSNYKRLIELDKWNLH